MAQPVSQGGIDYPDGGFSGGQGGFPMLGDLAEHAARVGSINTYDRRGSVVWMTDFEHGLQGLTPGTSDAECEYQIVHVPSHFGGYSLELNPSDEEDSYVEYGNVIQYLEAGKVGMEALISHSDNPYAIELRMFYFDGTTQHLAQVRYDPATGNWTIRTAITTWETVITGLEIQRGSNTWHPVKFVVDFEDHKYARLQVANRVVDLSDHSIYTKDADDLGQLAIRVLVNGSPALHAAMYVDVIIITQNE